MVTVGFVLLSIGSLGASLMAVFVVEGGVLPVIRARAAEAREAVAKREQQEAQSQETERMLTTLSVQLELVHMQERTLPPSLSGAPPEDAWGNPVRYVRRDADWGELLSAGPDGRFDTADDLRREVRPGR